MIAGIYKIEVVRSHEVDFPFNKVLNQPVLPILKRSDVGLRTGSSWEAFPVEKELTPFELSGNETDAGTVYEGTLPVHIYNASHHNVVKYSDWHGSHVLLMVTDNNNMQWLLGMPTAPVTCKVGFSKDAEHHGTDAVVLNWEVRQPFPPIPVNP